MHQDLLSYSFSFPNIKKQSFFKLLLLLFVLANPIQMGAQEKPFVVVLDAGHGGKDPGRPGTGFSEKEIALNIALKTGKLLEKIPEIKVIYTRKTDVFVELTQRASIANKANADLFVSIHCDAFTSPKAYGAGTFVLGLHANERNFKVAQKENSVIFLEEDYEKNYDGFDPNDPESVISLLLMQETYLDQSIVAAQTIQDSFVRNLNRKDRTVKQAGFVVLKYTYMPSVLVETGFLTNPREGAYLNSKKGQDDMASAISKAIINFRKSRNTSFQSETLVIEKEEEEIAPKTVEIDIKFKIQIAASKKKVDLKPYNFKGLKELSLVKSGKLYRYYFSESPTYTQAQERLQEAKQKGYTKAFIVAFEGDKKITISEALDHFK
ncbi:N-acetylmuramoyl-L-alanine amidase [Flavobacteriaceae bacterium]|jgi:N-acetylmuramoyl-L-alanine amidase|nr:N-acetylmuramoyl-L-alanine amidase [Flavobacteriaceae bacterium]